jgi:hypothetical protein
MLARSKARREGRDAQVMNVGLEAAIHRNPLQDHNQKQLLKVTTQGKTCNLISEVSYVTVPRPPPPET